MSNIARRTAATSPPFLYGALEFLSEFITLAKWKNEADREFLDSFFHCHALFSYLFREIEMKPDKLEHESPEGFVSSEVLMLIPRLVALCADKVLNEAIEEREVFAKTCCRAGLFEAMETVPSLKGDEVPELNYKSLLSLASSRGFDPRSAIVV